MPNEMSEPAASPAALGFVRVLDLSENIAGQFCCRMLADYGADVTLIEPPEGSATRRIGPFREMAGAVASPCCLSISISARAPLSSIRRPRRAGRFCPSWRKWPT